METLREQLSGAITVEHRKGQPFYFRKLEDEQPPPLVEQPPPIVEQPPPQVEQPPPPQDYKGDDLLNHRRHPPTGPPGSRP
uniref:Uncharacterized protein n=1 Tax=Fagus sylvatica TaxID=28930 RepID=A0A2N9ET38_FAGSY